MTDNIENETVHGKLKTLVLCDGAVHRRWSLNAITQVLCLACCSRSQWSAFALPTTSTGQLSHWPFCGHFPTPLTITDIIWAVLIVWDPIYIRNL